MSCEGCSGQGPFPSLKTGQDQEDMKAGCQGSGHPAIGHSTEGRRGGRMCETAHVGRIQVEGSAVIMQLFQASHARH